MKTAMIWGAGGGIGRALVKRLDHEGWTVLAASRHPEALMDLTPHAIQVDVMDPQQIAEVAVIATRLVPEVDLVAYAVGTIVSDRVKRMTTETWHRVLGANLTGAFLTTHAMIPLLSPRAHLFFLGAYDDRLRLPGLSAYAAAKAGLDAFVDTLAREQRRLHVTLVRPKAVDTTFWDQVPFKLPPGALKPDDVAESILDAYKEGHDGHLDL